MSRILDWKIADRWIFEECEQNFRGKSRWPQNSSRMWTKFCSIAILEEFHCHLLFFKTQLEKQLFRESVCCFSDRTSERNSVQDSCRIDDFCISEQNSDWKKLKFVTFQLYVLNFGHKNRRYQNSSWSEYRWMVHSAVFRSEKHSASPFTLNDSNCHNICDIPACQ